MPVEGNGSPELRTPLLSSNVFTLEIRKLEFQLTPPSVEVNAIISFPKKGTTTVPFGSTRGSAPEPPASSFEVLAAPQVFPPLVDVLIKIVPSSHSV
jgi:hypothetical protein